MSNPNRQRAAVQNVKIHRDARGTLFEPLTDTELLTQKKRAYRAYPAE
jgi:hypothetical protein